MVKRVPRRDPGAPKRNLSVYLMYQNAMRDTFKAQNPGMTFGQLSKYTSSMYASLPNAEKEAWLLRASQEKLRYEMEMATYVPAPGYDAKGGIVARASPPRAINLSTKDPNAPRRNISSYLLYQNAMRNTLKAEYPGASFGDLSKLTSTRYKNLTSQEKKLWDERARLDKQRFDAEISNYSPPAGYDSVGKLIEESRRKGQKKRDPDRPKRARGSYVLFTNIERPKIFAENPKIGFTALGVALGERWRAQSPEEREKYDTLAQKDKLRFVEEMHVYNVQKSSEDAARKAEVLATCTNTSAMVMASASYANCDPIVKNVSEEIGLVEQAVYYHQVAVPVGDDIAAPMMMQPQQWSSDPAQVCYFDGSAQGYYDVSHQGGINNQYQFA